MPLVWPCEGLVALARLYTLVPLKHGFIESKGFGKANGDFLVVKKFLFPKHPFLQPVSVPCSPESEDCRLCPCLSCGFPLVTSTGQKDFQNHHKNATEFPSPLYVSGLSTFPSLMTKTI